MGTKLNPGRFDCHDRALPDEPRFTLLARDPLAGFLVSIWSSVRMGDHEAAATKFEAMLTRAGYCYVAHPDVDMAAEAIECGLAMFTWRQANLGRWRDPARHPGVQTITLNGEKLGHVASTAAVDRSGGSA